jgi:1-deoxy-D-xylulose-5-phosphate reductoisomerase
MNAANESAVAAFLHDRIGFYDIPDIVAGCMERIPFLASPSLEDIFDTDKEARLLADGMVTELERSR